MLYHLCNFLAIASITTALVAPGDSSSSRTRIQEIQKNLYEPTSVAAPQNKIFNQFQAAATTLAAGAFLFTATIAVPIHPAFAATKNKPAATTKTNVAKANPNASPIAVQISVDGIPPSSLLLKAGSLPVVGGQISGRYAMVDDSEMGKPSITIKTPKDALGLLAGLKSGHLEADLAGVVSGHLNVDIAAKAGEATVKINSPLIPPLPFKNSASGDTVMAKGKTSDWSKVVNMGSGDTYYYNKETEVSQFGVPKEL